MIPIIVANKMITLIFDGEVYSGELTQEQIADLLVRNERNVLTKTHLNKLFINVKESEYIPDCPLLKKKNGSYYRKKIPVSLPKLLIEEYIENQDDPDTVESLDNFWRLCALNPDPRAREDLFQFLRGGKFTITPSGYIVTYRNVVPRSDTNGDLVNFLSKSLIQVKSVLKKKLKNYDVYLKDGEYLLIPVNKDCNGSYQGNLKSMIQNINLYSDLEFTDAHTRTFSIKLGEKVSMPREDCDADPDIDCSAGYVV